MQSLSQFGQINPKICTIFISWMRQQTKELSKPFFIILIIVLANTIIKSQGKEHLFNIFFIISKNWMEDTFIEHPRCSLCNALLPLVNQIYCPLENSCFHRVVYIFGCTNISCWNKKERYCILMSIIIQC